MTFPRVTAGVLPQVDAEIALPMDEDAFRAFYDRTSRAIWAYLHRMTGDRALADDLLQETYYRFLRADAPMDDDTHRRRYLFRIATNLARDRFRRVQARPLHVTHDENAPTGSHLAAGVPGVDDALDRRLDVRRALSRLSARERALLWLAYGHGASHREIADIVGVRAASVKTLLFRARRRFARLIGRRGGGQ